ncbi:MAG TPA: class I SAM-dependent RNA methyltransferase [Myxococcales bacterium]|nr:class I SAM-dependent RNA methyltransferase [Myxococcales bacterium]HIN85265.1 class I SAM-dependent RNA methyltransferase [Myxococcales bacterium]
MRKRSRSQKITNEITIERMASGPDAIAHLDDGRVAMVRGGVPGDTVTLNIINEHKRYVEATIETLLTPSPHRRKAPCRHAQSGDCGGCSWQHIKEDIQKSEKQAIVTREISRMAPDAVIRPIASPAPAFGYRRRTRFGHKGAMLGYRHRGQRRIFDLQECPVLDPLIIDELAAIKEAVSDWPSGNIDVMVDEENNVVVGGPATTFVQASKAVESALIDLVLQAIPSTAQKICELFAGAGTFSIPLHQRGHQVTTFELDRAAVDKLREVAPKIDAHRADLFRGNTEFGTPDCVLLDPPRKGALACLDGIIRTQASVICYVSCDLMTLCRDLRVLTENGYKLDWIQPVDAFPQTSHIESVSQLTLLTDSGDL